MAISSVRRGSVGSSFVATLTEYYRSKSAAAPLRLSGIATIPNFSLTVR